MSIPEFVASDPKAGSLFGVLSIAPFIIVGMLLAALGLGDLVTRFLDLLPNGLLAVPISFAIVYLTGWAVSAFARKMKSVKPDPSIPVVDPTNWSERR